MNGYTGFFAGADAEQSLEKYIRRSGVKNSSKAY